MNFRIFRTMKVDTFFMYQSFLCTVANMFNKKHINIFENYIHWHTHEYLETNNENYLPEVQAFKEVSNSTGNV